MYTAKVHKLFNIFFFFKDIIRISNMYGMTKTITVKNSLLAHQTLSSLIDHIFGIAY